ncbi:hypothetical protein NMG60_11032810 [Bertholletia excelsa]
MANISTSAQTLLLLLAIFLALTIPSEEARIPIPANQNKLLNSQLLLHDIKIGLDASKLEYYRRRSLNANSDRNAPGGPDPQHNSLPPSI